MAGKLDAIARDMRAAYLRKGSGTIRRELARGLPIQLGQRINHNMADPVSTWILVLSRPVTRPSVIEIEILRAAFGVPDEWLSQRIADNAVSISWPV